MATTATSIKLDSALKERIDRLAESQQRSAHWLMKQAIEDYVGRAEQEEALRTELVARHRRYQETGLHLTGDEVNEWIEATLRGENPPKLEPHT